MKGQELEQWMARLMVRDWGLEWVEKKGPGLVREKDQGRERAKVFVMEIDLGFEWAWLREV